MPNPTISEIVTFLKSREPRMGDTRLVLIDGPSGSGKTTLAGLIAPELDCQVITGDDIYEGWHGLPHMWPILGEQILMPLAEGKDASFKRWDWHAKQRHEDVDVPSADFLIVEGVGVAQRPARPYSALTIWVEAPWGVRLQRSISRDGEDVRGDLEIWQRHESIFLAEEGTRKAAHMWMDGTQPFDAA